MPPLDFSSARWRKSNRSSNVSNCVEITVTASAVAVRDSKNLSGGVLAIPPFAWAAFTTALHKGQFD